MTSLPLEVTIPVNDAVGSVSGILLRPERAHALLVFGHGAGAGMKHPFMETAAKELGNRGVATLRYQFPYVERGGRRPDHRSVLTATVRAAVSTAVDHREGLPLFAGGKSMGGRMTSLAASESRLPEIRGLVFVGFPLHPAGKPSTERGDHLQDLNLPMLFLQGTRDKLGDLDLLRPIVERLGNHAKLHVVAGGDHSFHVLKRSGRTDEEAMSELCHAISSWIDLAESTNLAP